MKKFVIGAINTVAFLMLVLGVIMFFVCIVKGDEAGRGVYTRDAAAQTMWYIGTIPSIMFVFNSFLIYGFSYVVEAACKYLERCEEDVLRQSDESEYD